MFKRMHHFALVVADLDASVAWYSTMLGFEPERRFGFPEVGLQFAHLISDTGIRIELLEQHGSSGSPDKGKDVFGALHTQGIKHVGLLVDDIEAAFHELHAKGVEIALEVTTVELAGVKCFWIRDNSGNLIEINQWLESKPG